MTNTNQQPHSFRADGPVPHSPATSSVPLYELSVEHARELDRRATHEYGIPSLLLMEHAALGLYAKTQRLIEDINEPCVLICCGPGNNGGDGFALARQLHNNSVNVEVICTEPMDRYTGDAGTNLAILQSMRVPISELIPESAVNLVHRSSVIVDGLFGTGLSRPIGGAVAELIGIINRERYHRKVPVVAVDCPSGLDAQTGHTVGEACIRADYTVTFAALKPGMANVAAIEYLGEVQVCPIGVPIELLEALGRRVTPPRDRD